MIPSPLPPPLFDAAAAFPDVDRWRAAVRDEDWPAVSSLLEGLAGVDARTYAMGKMVEIEHSEHFFRRVVETTGAVPARVLLALREIGIGWEIRTAQRASEVSREQFARLHEHLRTAEQLLIGVTAEEPDNAIAWEARLTTAMGLQLGHSEARRRYRKATAHHPHFLSAQLALLQQLCPKWGGSWEELHAFVRECVSAAPPGAPNAVLVLNAHIEHYIDGTAEEGVAHLRRPDVQAEILDAARRSVLHPVFRRDYWYYLVHGTFAWVFSVVGAYDKAAHHFRALGPYAAVHPWHYSGNPATEFVRHRDIALARG